MGLPDPVAFAMLTALGAIPDPMALLNEMMAAAAPEEDEKATFWKGPQFAADADSAELERLAKQVGRISGTWDLGGGEKRCKRQGEFPIRPTDANYPTVVKHGNVKSAGI